KGFGWLEFTKNGKMIWSKPGEALGEFDYKIEKNKIKFVYRFMGDKGSDEVIEIKSLTDDDLTLLLNWGDRDTYELKRVKK
ncbi:MAG TPA: hypothetical protein VKS79_16320, partial [Gemmataceae bacterium]|nr:hypothetical protein [Gemmataceae bacterium]